MKNNMFTGWNTVFAFTLKQGFNNAYKSVTAVLFVILLMVGVGANMYLAHSQQKSENISPIETVYVLDESGIPAIQWQGSKQVDEKQFPKVVFEISDKSLKELGTTLTEKEPKSVIAQIQKKEKAYEINIYLPHESEISKEDAKNLGKTLRAMVREGLIKDSGVDAEKVTYVVSSINSEFLVVGENAQSTGQRFMIAIFPMILMFGLYFMVLIYGQNMGNVVSVEKSSKLMETLLVMTRPYGIIFGKILATAITAIFQIAIWVVAVVSGFFVGDILARKMIYPDYDNIILALFRELAEDDSLHAFTIEAILLSVVAISIAFLFYCVVAGAIASFASKAEELGQVMAFYNMFLIIGFFGAYFIPNLIGQKWVKVVLRVVPFTASFLLPGEILVGTVKFGQGILYVLILFAWILGLCVLAGKVYKDQLFYKGKPLLERLPFVKKKGKQSEDENWQIMYDEEGKPLEKTQRIGYLGLAVSPLAIFFVLQLVASLAVMNVMTRVKLYGIDVSAWETSDYVVFYRKIAGVLNPLTTMVCHLCIILCFGLWMYFIRKGIDAKQIFYVKSLNSVKWKMLFTCVISALCLVFFANGTIVVEAYLIPSVVEDYMEMARTAGLGTSIFAILAAVFIAPIGEELLCRGVALHFSKKAFGSFWLANILQALLFGVLHANWVQGIYAFFIGLVLGLLVERYQSLVPSILVHFFINGSSSSWFPKVFGNVETTLPLGIVMVVVPCVIVIPLLILTQNKAEKMTPSANE